MTRTLFAKLLKLKKRGKFATKAGQRPSKQQDQKHFEDIPCQMSKRAWSSHLLSCHMLLQPHPCSIFCTINLTLALAVIHFCTKSILTGLCCVFDIF
uniref:Uncharacterized protein n=1 Tax=Rhizophora mucronata TaxID=61149 RepID=A0A2P2L3H4_RHIMU